MEDVVYRTCAVMMRGVLRGFSSWRVEGVANVPASGPLIVVANHLSNTDPPVLAASVPRRLHYLAKAGVFKPVVRTFLKAYGAHPLDRDGQDFQAMLWARRLLSRDGTLAFFPEAHRNPTTGLQRPMPGIALLAARTQTPLLPVGITGTENMGPLWRVAFPTGRITVRIGEPFRLPPPEGRPNRAVWESLADSVMARVATLLPPEYRGVYRDDAAGPPEAASLGPEGRAEGNGRGC
jgi:1-acyl-sn-glycerol-3-phosphate acyltransferase